MHIQESKLPPTPMPELPPVQPPQQDIDDLIFSFDPAPGASSR